MSKLKGETSKLIVQLKLYVCRQYYLSPLESHQPPNTPTCLFLFYSRILTTLLPHLPSPMCSWFTSTDTTTLVRNIQFATDARRDRAEIILIDLFVFSSYSHTTSIFYLDESIHETAQIVFGVQVNLGIFMCDLCVCSLMEYINTHTHVPHFWGICIRWVSFYFLQNNVTAKKASIYI